MECSAIGVDPRECARCFRYVGHGLSVGSSDCFLFFMQHAVFLDLFVIRVKSSRSEYFYPEFFLKILR